MSGIYASSLLILFFAPRAAALLSRFRSTFLRWRSSLTFIDHSEDGHKAPIPTTPYPASTLAEEAYRALIDTTYLQHTIQMILETVHDKLAPGTLCPSYLYYWSFWLQTQPITVTFAPYSNQTKWGWVLKEKENQGFNVSILRDLAELTQETPPGYISNMTICSRSFDLVMSRESRLRLILILVSLIPG
ncbi:hypothetical protein DFH06DRAFT_1470020 [Mycena polygramma]|nr:hypothetical protein DFH06DRAFT_1470020 [Mycena polygramma]